MSYQLLDGRQVAKQLQSELKSQVETLWNSHQVRPHLAAILVGDDPASQVYVRNKQIACEKIGMHSQLHRMAADATEDQLIQQIELLNNDSSVHGILVQLPLPRGMNVERVLDTVTADKDVDAFHPYNVGLLAQGRPRFLPCTPYGVLQILYRYGIKTRGRRVCVLGRSDIVGKPAALLLVQRDGPLGPDWANATVTVCHSGTPNLFEHTRAADILIAAIGKPNFVTADMVKPGVVVVDVGINRIASGLVGDVDFESVAPISSAITPVPGGVGPLTVTMLLHNTLTSAKHATGLITASAHT